MTRPALRVVSPRTRSTPALSPAPRGDSHTSVTRSPERAPYMLAEHRFPSGQGSCPRQIPRILLARHVTEVTDQHYLGKEHPEGVHVTI
jgi:hypothetical protein